METLRQLRRLGAAAHMARCAQRSYTSEEAYTQMEKAEAMSGMPQEQSGGDSPIGQPNGH